MLRPADDGDLAPAAALFAPLFQAGVFRGAPPRPPDLAAAVWAGSLFVADVHSELAGVMLLREGEIGVAVAPAYRRQGVATSLVGIAKARHRRLHARADTSNAASRALFGTLGFREATAAKEGVVTLSWRAQAPVCFVPDGQGGFQEQADGRPGGLLVRRDGRFVLLDPTGGEGYLDALPLSAAPAEIRLTRTPGPSFLLAALGTFLPIAATPACRGSLLEMGIVPDRTLPLLSGTRAEAT